jgi:uncharacterized SAM-binding protein YcdF (DUF218 family)
LPLLLLLGFVGVFTAWRASATSQRPWLLTLSFVGLLFISWSPFAWLLSRPLEIWYEQTAMPKEMADAIVVLAGGYTDASPVRHDPVVSEDSYQRLRHAAWLFQSWSPHPILTCGGNRNFTDAMRHVLESEGIPSNLIWTEIGSRTTHENAVNCREILQQHGIHRIALVVDASSMWRAAASFRKVGITVVPAPIQFQDFDFTLSDVLPTWKAIRSTGLTIHESVGLLWYWLRGWI